MSILGDPYDEAIRKSEGFSSRPQWDYKQWSNGYGTRASGPGDVVDEAEAKRRYDAEIDKAHGVVTGFMPGLDPGSQAALTSLTYNSGDAWTRSGLGAAVKNGDWDKARASFLQYNKAGGATLPGLQSRRGSEVGWLNNAVAPNGELPRLDIINPDGSNARGAAYASGGKSPMADYQWNEPNPWEMAGTGGQTAPEDDAWRRRMPAPMAGGMQHPAPPMASPQARPDQPRQPSLLDQIVGRAQNPLFQQGLGLFLAASQGKDLNEGLNAGSTRAKDMQDVMMKNLALQRQQESAAKLQAAMQDPAIRGQVPPALLAMGDPAMIAGYIAKHPEMELERRRLDLTNRQLEANIALSQKKQASQFTAIGEDEYGNKKYGFVDPVTQTISPAQIPGVSGQPEASGPPLTGDDYLKTLPPGMASQVKAISDGRAPYPAGYALRSPAGRALIAAVGRYEPGFDATKYAARAAAERDLTAGKSADNLRKLNTAVGHVDTMNQSIDALGNTDYPWWNSISGAASRASGNVGYQKALAKFETAKEGVAGELTAVFRGSGSSTTEIEAWKHKISAANTPTELREATNTAIEMLHSRLSAVAHQYEVGTGKKKELDDLLSPEAKQAWARITKHAVGNKEKGTAEGGGTSIAPGAVMDGYRYKGGNPSKPESWEVIR